MLLKTTTKLFGGKYQHKIVLICAGAIWFRNTGLENALTHLRRVNLKTSNRPIKTQDELDYAFKLYNALISMKDIDIRVESPWLTVYTNDKTHINALIKLDNAQVKYTCSPTAGTELTIDTVIMPKMKYDYRCTLGKINIPNLAFLEWAETNAKLKLTKSCKKDLLKNHSWGGTHFYVTGDNNLLMSRMHLGGCISKVERILKN